MTIYFALVGQHVKVGFSNSVETRLRCIKYDSLEKPEGFDSRAPVEVLRLAPGEGRTERHVHEALSDFRAVGEWFHATPQCLAAIAWLTSGEPEDDLLARARKQIVRNQYAAASKEPA